MSRPPEPTRSPLRADVDAEAIERVWRNVQGARQARSRRTQRARWAAVVLAAAAAVALVAWQGRDLLGADSGALHLAGGAEIGALVASAAAPVALSFADGSRVELEPGTRLEPLENGSRAFSALLTSGRATFDVRPGGPRRWTIECGIATVEVVGTRFTVERTAGGAHVAVERGVVLVRGERVRDRVQRLVAGESLDVGEAPVPAAVVPARPATSSAAPQLALAPAVSGVPAAVAASPQPTAPPAWRKLAQGGDNARAYAELGPAGIASASQNASVDDLLALADVARLSAHPSDAITPLSRVLGEHPSDPRAPLAAFTLGRLQLDSLKRPAPAAEAFERAIALGLPQSLQEDAYARLVEARARGGDLAGARAAADEYRRRFPNGQRFEQVQAWARTE